MSIELMILNEIFFMTDSKGEKFQAKYENHGYGENLVFQVGEHKYVFANGLNVSDLISCHALLKARLIIEKG
jgi:hypothetical protein